VAEKRLLSFSLISEFLKTTDHLPNQNGRERFSAGKIRITLAVLSSRLYCNKDVVFV
jgi:hypothetical protein